MFNTSHNKNLTNNDISFRSDRCLENLRRLNIISKVLIIYVIWLGCITCYYLLVEAIIFARVSTFVIIYSSFFVFNCIAMAVSGKLIKAKSIKSYKLGDLFVVACAFVIVLFGVLITLMDQKDYGHLMVYFICVFCCMSYFLLSTREIALSFFLTAALMGVGLWHFQPDPGIRMTHYLNIGLFLPLTFLISRIIYRDYKSRYLSIRLLEKETQRSKNLYRELDQANHILRKLASIDDLTGIANRRGLNHYLEISLEGCANHKLPLFAAMVDIDCFKEYNDTYGHLKGDFVLKHVSEQLSIIAAEISGLAARWGGEEFIVVACGMTAGESHEVCERILKAVEALKIEHLTSKTMPIITVSIGACSMFIKTQNEFGKCVECADKALYYAKQQGRNRYKHFDFTN